MKLPKYRLHRPSGRALVEHDGKRHYLPGKHGTDESKAAYRQFVDRILAAASQNEVEAMPVDAPAIVENLCLSYLKWSKGYYGEKTSEFGNMKSAIQHMLDAHGNVRLDEFGPMALKDVRRSMVEAGWARTHVNHQVRRLVRVFKWAVEHEFCQPSVYLALKTVGGLRAGRTTAPERPPITSVDDATIDATLPFLPPVVADMVRFQRRAGCRPDEVCRVRPCDIDRSGEVWIYGLAAHKTAHHGRTRMIFIGPHAQAILKPYLARPDDAYCFSPAESEQKRKAAMRKARRSKVQPSQQSRAKRSRKKEPGERYDSRSYAHAIRKACKRAFGEDGKRWSPNQLRHSVATLIRRQFGLEAAQVTLGHSRADVTQIYAERDLSLGVTVASAIG